MKKRFIAPFVALIAASLLLTACAPRESAHKIGVLAPHVTHGWTAGVSYYAGQRCAQLKSEGKIDYIIYTSTNAAEMTAQLADLIEWGAKAVVAFPQWTGMEEPIQSAIDSGIVVVNFDLEIDADGVYRVAGDNYSIGVEGARYIVEKIGTDGRVVILDSPATGSVAQLRKAGFLDTLKQIAPNMATQVYTTRFTREAGLSDMAAILAENAHIDAVFSMDDETSIGALRAIRDAGRTDIKVITGGGGAQEYFNMMLQSSDIWIQSALYSPSMVMTALDMAVDILDRKAVPQEMIIPTAIVDRTNAAEYLDAESPY